MFGVIIHLAFGPQGETFVRFDSFDQRSRSSLIARTDQYTGIGSCGFYIRNADALHAELLGRGASLDGEPVSHPWGLRDFTATDLEGNRLTFAETFE